MNYFDDPGSKHFSFESFAMGLDSNTFGVINFKGYESISKPYDFEIMLVSSNKNIDLEDMLQAQAVFTIHRGTNDDVLYNGILSEFDQLHEVNDIIFYRARLVPKLWWLTLTHHNQVFLNQSVPDFIEDGLRDGGLETADIDIATLNGFEEIAYICQYDESHFNFVSRWMERQGIYYYFDQQADGEVMVLTDNKFSHQALKQGADLFYNPASGLEGTHMGEAIGSFTCRQKQLPAEIILKDFNYEKPSLDITSKANVDSKGRGISYIYGEFFATQEEGERLAEIRAEELLCQKQEFFGESTVPYIMPGFTFNMHNHYRDEFNQEYLILEVTHEGNQSHLMSGGIAAEAGQNQNQSIYRNSFKAIPNETQYRPERLTEKPKISGTIHAMIDAETDGEYAQIDEQGRYRVKLPFDINDEHMDGKGSAPVRMMQSYAGKHRGMQFPLIKGTEVLLTFIEGNPDRPVIAGAVSNPETQGPVSAENLTESVIQSGGNNKIRMEDQSGSERIVLDSPAANSWIRVGSPNDPITLNGEATVYVEKGSTWSDPGAVKHPDHAITAITQPGITATTTLNQGQQGLTASTTINQQASTATTTLQVTPVTPIIKDFSGAVVADDAAALANAGIYKYTYMDGNDTAIRTVVVYEPGEEIHSTVIPDSNGIRVRSAGDLWLEAQSRYGEYHIGKPVIAPSKIPLGGSDPGDHVPKQIGDLLGQFGHDASGVAKGYSPTGMLTYLKDATGTHQPITMNNALSQGHIRVSSLDTFITQEGNIYDFGGYWNYNLGNSYSEDHLDQKAALNADHTYDLLNQGGPNFTGWTPVENSTSHKRIARVEEIAPHASNNSSFTNLWVEKKFGDTYEYTEGSTISVTKGGSQDVEIGGVHVEESYRGDGTRKSWSIRGVSGQPSQEKKWTGAGTLIYHSSTTVTDASVTETVTEFDRVTGVMYASSSSSGTGGSKATASFDSSATASASFHAGANASISGHAAISISSETFLAGKISNDNYIGVKVSNENFLGFKAGFEFTLAGSLKVENTDVTLSFPGTKIKTKTNVIDTKANDIKLLGITLNQMATQLNTAGVVTETVATVKLSA